MYKTERAGRWIVGIIPIIFCIGYIWTPSGFHVITNDFIGLYYNQKVYFLDLFGFGGHFPLWSPSEAAGYPYWSNPFNAVFYPLNLLLILSGYIFGGFSFHHYQIFTVLALSIFSVGTYQWLRQLDYPVKSCIFSSSIVACSFKMTELLRFPNAIHTACWFPWLFLGLEFIANDVKRWRGIVLSAISIFMIFTAGYIYFVYYLQFLVFPYAAYLVFSSKKIFCYGNAINNRSKLGFFEKITRIIVSLLIPLTLTWFYFLRMKSSLEQTADRSGGNYIYSTSHTWTWIDIVGSLIYPPVSIMEGWFFFGFVSLVYIFSYIIYNLYCKNNHELIFIISVVIWIIFHQFLIYTNSPLFVFFWKNYPGFNSLRVWPRANILLMLPLAILLARSWNWFEYIILKQKEEIRAIKLIVIITISVIIGQIFFILVNIKNPYWIRYIEDHIEVNKYYFVISCLTTCLSIALLLRLSIVNMFGFNIKSKFWLSIIIVLNLISVWPIGAHQWCSNDYIQHVEVSKLNLSEKIKKSIDTPRVLKNQSISLSEEHGVGIIENWYFNRYVIQLDKWISLANDKNKILNIKKLLGMLDGRRIFISKKIDHATPEEFIKDIEMIDQVYNIIYYDGDKLVIKTDLKEDYYINFIDNWDPFWHADIDHVETKIYLLFSTFKSVKVPKGLHEIRFYYNPLKKTFDIFL